jgi:hypothetical protein
LPSTPKTLRLVTVVGAELRLPDRDQADEDERGVGA